MREKECVTMPRASIKANAKENLRGNWGTAILVLLLN